MFWEQTLLYNIELRLLPEEKTIKIFLSCKLWFNNKIKALLENPLGLHTFPTEKRLTICYLNEVKIIAEFYKVIMNKGTCQYESIITIGVIRKSLNQFFCSLVISQLEFKFPMVFSPLARTRISIQDIYFAPISHFLTNSTRLIPLLVKISTKDKTATTSYLLLLPKNRPNIQYVLNIV